MCPMNPRLLRPTASGIFDPRKIAGLNHWFDASDSTTVTLDSGRVASIADKVGGLTAANSSSGSTQPNYVIGSQNGRNVMRFVAADSTLLTLNSALTSGTGGNLVFSSVGVFFRQVNTQEMFGFGLNAGVNQSYHHRIRGTLDVRHQSSVAESVFSPGTSALAVIATIVRNAGTSTTLRINGTEQVDTVSTGVTNTSPRSISAIGRVAASGTQYSTGDIGELLVWQRLLTLDERVAIERGLARKWGVTL